MRSAEELQVELVRTRRRLHRVTGVMTFVFIAGVAVVFAAVGGALVVVDKRAAETLAPAPSSPPHQAATTGSAPTASASPQPRAATVAQASPKQPSPSPAAPAIHADAGTIAGASAGARASAAAAPANPPPQTPQTHPQPPAPTNTMATTAAVNPTTPSSSQPTHQALQQAPSGAGRDAAHIARPAAVPPPPAAQASQPLDTKHAARTRPPRERKTAKTIHSDEANGENSRRDTRTTVGAVPNDRASRAENDNAARAEDARARRRGYVRVRPGEEEEAADARDGQRVIVLGPRQRYTSRPHARDDDEGGPPHQRGGLFGGVLSGIFGPDDE